MCAPNNAIRMLVLCHMIKRFVCFVALLPKSTAMVMAGRSVHLTTLFPGLIGHMWLILYYTV